MCACAHARTHTCVLIHLRVLIKSEDNWPDSILLFHHLDLETEPRFSGWAARVFTQPNPGWTTNDLAPSETEVEAATSREKLDLVEALVQGKGEWEWVVKCGKYRKQNNHTAAWRIRCCVWHECFLPSFLWLGLSVHRHGWNKCLYFPSFISLSCDVRHTNFIVVFKCR